jgi:uncharacterized protein (TIGR02246 family)
VVRRTASGPGEKARDEMIRRLLRASPLVLAASLAAEPVKVLDREEGAVRRMATRFAETWNAHDIEALAELFAEDADFVNVAGTRLKGRAQIRTEHAQRHEMQFKDSTLTIRGVAVRFPRSDVAIAHVEWAMKGDRDSDGTSRPPREGVMSWTVVKEGAAWRIAASHNTDVRSPAASK